MLFKVFEHSSSALPTAAMVTKGAQMTIDVMMKEDRNAGLILVFDCSTLSATVVAILLIVIKQFFTLFMVSPL